MKHDGRVVSLLARYLSDSASAWPSARNLAPVVVVLDTVAPAQGWLLVPVDEGAASGSSRRACQPVTSARRSRTPLRS